MLDNTNKENINKMLKLQNKIKEKNIKINEMEQLK